MSFRDSTKRTGKVSERGEQQQNASTVHVTRFTGACKYCNRSIYYYARGATDCDGGHVHTYIVTYTWTRRRRARYKLPKIMIVIVGAWREWVRKRVENAPSRRAIPSPARSNDTRVYVRARHRVSEPNRVRQCPAYRRNTDR